PASPRSPSRFPRSSAAPTRSRPADSHENRETMTTTAPAAKKPAATKSSAAAKPTAAAGIGRVARVTGPVVDIEFPHDSIPTIYNALKTTITIDDVSTEITLEVAQHLGDDLVRAIALKPTDGLVRGQEVRDTGAPISVPVGDA